MPIEGTKKKGGPEGPPVSAEAVPRDRFKCNDVLDQNVAVAVTVKRRPITSYTVGMVLP